MPETSNLISHIYLKIGGQDMPEEFMRALVETQVENSLHLPDVATLKLNDPKLTWIDDSRLVPGKTLEISSKSSARRSKDGVIFDGEIVEVEPHFGASTQHLTIRAFDRLHRLARGRRVRTFLNVTDGDIATQFAKEAGLEGDIAATRIVHPYLLQYNQTNLEFLRERASAIGYMVYVLGKKLCFKPPASVGTPIELRWGESLQEFNPRLTTLGQVNKVTARGWDPRARQEIIATVSKAKGFPDVQIPQKGGDAAKNAFGIEAEHLVVSQPLRTQASADHLAQSVADRIVERFVEADGMCGGNPAIVAGASITVDAVGDQFKGTYFVTNATHIYGADGYSTHFIVSGQSPTDLLSLIRQSEAVVPSSGLVIGIVTDNQDPEGMGRIKVKYPWLSSEHASDWARVVAPGAGPERGMEFLPEIDDEVLVAFEMGDIHFPYIVGGLWNGKDALPKKNNAVISGGKVKERIIRSRTGHLIVLNDDDGGGGITIEDKNGNKIVLDTSSNGVTIQLKGKLLLKTQGDIEIDGASIKLNAQGEVKVTGSVINLN